MTIYSFETCNKSCGGKAYGLNLLYKNNIPVPEGIVISDFDVRNDKDIEKINQFISSFEKKQLFAIRSSANIEDGKIESFAGIFDTILDVENDINKVLSSIKKVIDSVSSNVVKAYTTNKNIKMNIIIQKMIKPKLSGVCFTNAIDDKGEEVVLIEIVRGLGEQLVSGTKNSFKMIIPRKGKEIYNNKIRYNGDLINISLFSELFVYIDQIIKKFDYDVDLEWCIDENDKPYLLQMRPITKTVNLSNNSDSINRTGIIITKGIAQGKACLIDSNLPYEEVLKKIEAFEDGDILISNTTETYYLPAMKKAAGIITESGSILCHAAIVAREYNIPCIVAYEKISDIIKNGDTIVLDTINSKIKVNDKDLAIDDNYNFNYFDLDCFDEYFSYKINDKIFYIESTFKGIVIHGNENPHDEEMLELERFVRKQFNTNPHYSIDNNKYLWIQELERFKKLPSYMFYYNQIINSSKIFDAKILTMTKTKCISIIKNLVKTKQKSKDLILNFFIDEYCAAINELLVGIIPFGAPLKESFNQSIQLLEKENLSFNDLLNEKNFVKNNKLKAIQKYLNVMSKIKNDTYQEIWDLNAMDPDYFEKRNDAILRLLSQKGIKAKEKTINILYQKFLPKIYKELEKIVTWITLKQTGEKWNTL